jgi:hypothetical protein
MHRDRLVRANLESAGLPHPSPRTLHHVANFPQPAAVRGSGGGPMILAAPLPQPLVVARSAVSAIPIPAPGLAPGAAAGAPDRSDGVQPLQGLRRLRTLGSRDAHRPRRPPAVSEQGAFRAFLGPIRGVLAGERPPKTARMLWLSTTALDQSICSSWPKRSSSVGSTFFQMPRRCQYRRRRQQVTPEPPFISWGSIHQGRPLWRTKTMPVRQARSSTGGRPRFPGRALWRGNSGWTTSPRSSGTKGSARARLPSATVDRSYCRKRYF